MMKRKRTTKTRAEVGPSNPHFGEVYASDYFESRIVVVGFSDDKNWTFVVERAPYAVLTARTPLSEMERIE